MNYGATVTELHVPRTGKGSIDVVLGFKDKARYFDEHPFFGSMAGRVAGRITHGQLRYNGHDIELEQNDRGNHLHGGSDSLHARVWRAEPFVEGEGVGLQLSITSEDGDNGYPGKAEISVRYTIGEDNSLTVETAAAVTELIKSSQGNPSRQMSAWDIPARSCRCMGRRMTPIPSVKSQSSCPNSGRDMEISIGSISPGKKSSKQSPA
jgi:hypothetical protein